jgi:hypothetical protein
MSITPVPNAIQFVVYTEVKAHPVLIVWKYIDDSGKFDKFWMTL